MFLKPRRILPEGKETDLVLNSEQIVWAQPDSTGATVTIFPSSGPELTVKKSDVTDELLSGSLGT
jgi:hypothetical protein